MRLSRLLYHAAWEDLPRLWWGHYRNGFTLDRKEAEHRAPAPHAPRLDAEAVRRLLDARAPQASLSERSYPLLAHLVRLALLEARPLRVFDFGGSAGTHYAEARRLLPEDRIEAWTVCELPEIAALGAAESARRGWSRLRFVSDPDALAGTDLAIASGVMQVAGEPFLDALGRAGARPRHVLVATAELTEAPTFHSIQQAPPALPDYRGTIMTSYNREAFIGRFAALGYRVADAWHATPHRPVVFRSETVVSSGFLFEADA